MSQPNNSGEWYEYYCMASNWCKNPVTRPVVQHFVKTLSEHNELVHKTFNCKLNVAYGEREREKIDFIFPRGVDENQSGLPIVVYVHGGYWIEGDRSLYNCIAKPYAQENCVVAIIGYDLSSESVKVPDIEAQCVKALEFINWKFPSSKIIITGHSAGGYLASAMCTHQHLSDSIYALVSLAGCYDLEDLAKTLSVSKAIALDKLDKQNLLQRKFFLDENHKIYIFLGQDDSPYLQMQSLKFHEKVSKGNNVTFVVLKDEDHFSLVENCLNIDFVVTKSILNLLKELNNKD